MSVYLRIFFINLIVFLCVGCTFAKEGRVEMSKVEEFKINFSRVLPKGTSKEKVEKHILDLGLEYSYVDSERKLYAIARRIGRYRMIYQTSLLIRIQLDRSLNVESIVFETEHSGL
jgi:hypothetical protein